MILSIIVISHNQKEQLKRCIDSILSQELPFEHEIIISDDASTDGTWELIQEYATIESRIKALQCNTDNYNPSNNGSRGGWNRCYAYPHATGKYIAFVDGDDFFIKGSDICKKQVELLELHSECSCCMANDYNLNDSDSVSNVTLRHQEILPSGEIMPSEEYIKNSWYFRESHCFVYRRNPFVDPVKLYGGYFEDCVITDHHIQYGDIVCLNEAGYVYVQYPSSIWAQQIKSKDFLIFAHGLFIPILIPKWRQIMLSSPSRLSSISNTVRLALFGHKINKENLLWIQPFDLFVYNSFNRKQNFLDKFHLLALWVYLKLLVILKPKIQVFYKPLQYIL